VFNYIYEKGESSKKKTVIKPKSSKSDKRRSKTFEDFEDFR
jgi:hypothetical protein